MNKYDEKIWDLLITVLSDEATLQEQQMLETWLAEDREHYSFYKRLKKIWDRASDVKMEDSPSFNYERGLNSLRAKIAEKEKTKVHQLSASLRNNSTYSWKVAASVLLLLASLSVFATIQFWQSPTEKYTTSETERQLINLPDGSTVMLNGNSEIEFQKNFTADLRKVTLHGEAFFEVEENEKRPFKVYFNNGTVEVLGTSFNVKQVESSGEIMVTVKEGVVSLFGNRSEENIEVKLSAGQIGILNYLNNTINVEDTNIHNYFGWLYGNISFQDMPFSQVCTQLERIYEINCQLEDKSLTEIRLTVYTENIQLDNVLNTIAISLGITYQRNGDSIIWRK